MTPRELERLKKDSIYSLQVTNDLKDQVINSYLNDLVKVVRTNVKKRELVVLEMEND